MSKKTIDRTGQSFNNWTFIRHIPEYKRNAVWLCRCKCGEEFQVLAYNVVNGSSKQCKSCTFVNRTKNYKDTIPTPMWHSIVRNAKKRNRDFLITKEYAEEIFKTQDGRCSLSNLDIKFAESNKDYKLGNQTASLDRIDSFKGYIEGNVQWVHKTINLMKNDLDEKEFIRFCKKIVDHSKNTNIK